MNDEMIKLTRDCPAIRIPSGESITLHKDSEVAITQALGGSYTLMTSLGMARVQEEEADALGLEKKIAEPEEKQSDKPLSDDELKTVVWDRLKTVFDPEIPVNIVDLGLVYSMEIKSGEGGGKRIDVDMTLTAPGCGMGPTIQADAQGKVLSIPGVDEAEVKLVWDPPWNQDMITEHGKMKLGMI